MSKKQNSNTRKAVILTLISVAFTLVVAEVALRVIKTAGIAPEVFSVLGQAKPPLDVRDGPGMYYVHPYSAYNHKPGYERLPFERINNLGFRGEDLAVEKPANTYRIVALGGSTTFGVYLPHDNTYPYYLQRNLNERLGGALNVEVANAGMSGSTTAESLHRLFFQVLPIKPDMVVIYHGYNDLFPRIFDDFQDDYFHFRRANPNNPPGMSRFLVYRLILRVVNPIAFNENYDLMNRVWKTDNLPESDAARLQNFIDTSEAAFEANLDHMVKVLLAYDVQPVLATFANQRDGLHWNDYIPAYAWEEGINQNNRAIRRVAKKYDLPLVPFSEEASDLPATNPWRKKTEGCCYTDSIHMSSEGNSIKARIFADTIEPIIRKEIDGQ
ncbi:MAG: SGNH/GDSL hydrolase family protein [Gammaproteobacteria bacterium]